MDIQEPTVSSALSRTEADDVDLLNSVVSVARSIFGAAAGSVFLFDRETDELVFEAVSGEGESFLVGTRFPADRGIAGWVLATGQSMTTAELDGSRVFARDLAESTGYVPDAIMAVPVVHQGTTLGVLQVLDPHPQSRSSIADLELLSMFADQAALSLSVLVKERAVRKALREGGGGADVLARIAGVLARMEPDQRAQGLQLLDSLHSMLSGMQRGA